MLDVMASGLTTAIEGAEPDVSRDKWPAKEFESGTGHLNG
jgi:hypothetical protein